MDEDEEGEDTGEAAQLLPRPVWGAPHSNVNTHLRPAAAAALAACCAVPAGPSPAVRKRLSQQMSALEAQMWDPAPEPTKPSLLSKAVSALFVAAALLVVVGGCRQRSAASTSSLPAQQQEPHSLLVDARG
jgi:hypothetical protein